MLRNRERSLAVHAAGGIIGDLWRLLTMGGIGMIRGHFAALPVRPSHADPADVVEHAESGPRPNRSVDRASPRALRAMMADSEGSSIAPRSPLRVWHALRWSLNGLALCWRLESSFRLECYLVAVLAPVGLWLGADGVERALLVGSLMLVLCCEVMNSAIEAVVDRWGPEWNEHAGRAKDMGSAAVFLLMMNVILTWGLVLMPRWLAG
jgi:diacylglycerol kinase (ATP)